MGLIKRHAREAGSQKVLAFRWGISQQYLTDVLKQRRMPNKNILDPLGFLEVTMYKRIYQSGDKADELIAGSQVKAEDLHRS